MRIDHRSVHLRISECRDDGSEKACSKGGDIGVESVDARDDRARFKSAEINESWARRIDLLSYPNILFPDDSVHRLSVANRNNPNCYQ